MSLGFASALQAESQSLTENHIQSIKDELSLNLAETSADSFASNFPVNGVDATCPSCDHKLCSIMQALNKKSSSMFRSKNLGGSTSPILNVFVNGLPQQVAITAEMPEDDGEGDDYLKLLKKGLAKTQLGYHNIGHLPLANYIGYLSNKPVETLGADDEGLWAWLVEGSQCGDAFLFEGAAGDSRLKRESQEDRAIFPAFEIFENHNHDKKIKLKGDFEITLNWSELPKFIKSVHRIHDLPGWSVTGSPVEGDQYPGTMGEPGSDGWPQGLNPANAGKPYRRWDFDVNEENSGLDAWICEHTEGDDFRYKHHHVIAHEEDGVVSTHSLSRQGNQYCAHVEDLDKEGKYSVYTFRDSDEAGAATSTNINLWTSAHDDAIVFHGDNVPASVEPEKCGEGEGDAGDDVLTDDEITNFESDIEALYNQIIEDLKDFLASIGDLDGDDATLFSDDYINTHITKIYKKYMAVLNGCRSGKIRRTQRVVVKLQKWVISIQKCYNRLSSRMVSVCGRRNNTVLRQRIVTRRTVTTKRIVKTTSRCKRVSTKIVTSSSSFRAFRFVNVTRVTRAMWADVRKFFCTVVAKWEIEGINFETFTAEGIAAAGFGEEFDAILAKFNNWAAQGKFNKAQKAEFSEDVTKVEECWTWVFTVCKDLIEKLREKKCFRQAKMIKSWISVTRRQWRRRLLNKTFNKWCKKFNIVRKRGMTADAILAWKAKVQIAQEFFIAQFDRLVSYNNFETWIVTKKSHNYKRTISLLQEIMDELQKFADGDCQKTYVNRWVWKSKKAWELSIAIFRELRMHFRLAGNGKAHTEICAVILKWRRMWKQRCMRKFKWMQKNLDLNKIVTFSQLLTLTTHIKNLYIRLTTHDRDTFIKAGYDCGEWGTAAHIKAHTGVDDFLAEAERLRAEIVNRAEGACADHAWKQKIRAVVRLLQRYFWQWKKQLGIVGQKVEVDLLKKCGVNKNCQEKVKKERKAKAVVVEKVVVKTVAVVKQVQKEVVVVENKTSSTVTSSS